MLECEGGCAFVFCFAGTVSILGKVCMCPSSLWSFSLLIVLCVCLCFSQPVDGITSKIWMYFSTEWVGSLWLFTSYRHVIPLPRPRILAGVRIPTTEWIVGHCSQWLSWASVSLLKTREMHNQHFCLDCRISLQSVCIHGSLFCVSTNVSEIRLPIV